MLTLRGLLFRLFFGYVPSHQTSAHRAYNRVVSGIVPGDPAHNRTLHTAGRVRRADRSRGQRNRRKGGLDKASFHLKVPC